MCDDAGREVVIFTEAIRLPVGQRAAFLDRACAGDENLRRKVLTLLGAHERVGDFLENSPFKAGGQVGLDRHSGTRKPGQGAENGGSK